MSSRTKTPAAAGIEAAQRAAFRFGQECYRPDVDIDEVRRFIGTHGTDGMADVEAAAYNRLSPANWWVNVARGWNAAAMSASTTTPATGG